MTVSHQDDIFGPMRRTGTAALFAFAIVAFGAACNAVLGLDDLQPRVDAGTPDASDGGPLRIANPGVAPTCLILRPDSIYYCIGQRVIVAKRDGSEAHDFVAEAGVGAFAVGPAGAWWTSKGALLMQELDGGSPTMVVDGGALDFVTTDGPLAYFAAATDGGVEVRVVSGVSGPSLPPTPILQVSALESMMATDGTSVLIADENRVTLVVAGFLDGGPSLSLDATAPRGVTGSSKKAYWLRGDTATVDTTLNFITTQPVEIAHAPTAFAASGDDIYTVNANDGLVLRRTPTDTKIVATGQNGVRLIAVDDVSIVWATSSAIFILPRF